MGLCDDVREHCAEVAAGARRVRIDVDRLDAIEPGPPPALDPASHYLDGPAEEVALFTLELDAINFGSGWFPTLRKRPGCSGSVTIARALTEHGPWPADGPARASDADEVAAALGQDPAHELMAPVRARAARARRVPRRALGARRGRRGGRLGRAAGRPAGRRACRCSTTPASTSAPRSRPPTWRWPASPSSTTSTELTIFADNLVPHVLRVDGVLAYDDELAARIDAGELLPPGAAEREIRACAVHACELIAPRLGVPPRTLDNWLWNRGQQPRYKARAAPPHAHDGSTSRRRGRCRGGAAAGVTSRRLGPLAGQVGDQPLELVDAARPAPFSASATGSGRWAQSASGPSGLRAVHPHRVAGVADDRRVGRHVVDDHRVGADLRAVADLDRPEQLGARAHHHVVARRSGGACRAAKPVPPSVTPW